MAYSHLLDTNIVSHLVRNPTGIVYRQLGSVGENNVCTSIVVACELRFGAQKSGSHRLQHQLEQILQLLPVLPLVSPVDIYYGDIRASLERNGIPIGPNDLLIAAHALALDAILVTTNLRDFERVSELRCANWI